MIRICWISDEHLYWVDGEFFSVIKVYEALTISGTLDSDIYFLFNAVKFNIDSLCKFGR